MGGSSPGARAPPPPGKGQKRARLSPAKVRGAETMDDLAGRMAVVTGGGSGLGRPYAWATDSAVRILCWSSHALWRWCRSSAPICSKSSVSIARMLQAAVEQVFARDIEHAVAAHILVHDLFEPLKTL